MHTTSSNPIARLLAPLGKLTLALFGAAAIGTAWAADNVWEGDDDGYWGTDANWSNPSGDYWVINGNAVSKAIKFNGNPTLGYTLAIVTDGVAFSGDTATDGLVQTVNDVRVGAWANGALTISSGTHVLNELAVSSAWWNNTGAIDGSLTVAGGSLTVNTTTWVGSGNEANAPGSDGVINVSGGSVTFVGTPTLGCVAGATGTLNLNGGTATASTIVQGGGTGYVNFNGGTLAAAAAGTLIDSGLTVAINAGGGTIATDYDVTVAPAMTGTGSLTKTGAGVLTLSTMPTFSGTITVAADAGSVILPAGATVEAGIYTATRAVENGVEYYANPPTTITQDDIVGDSIVLTEDTILNVTANAVAGNLAISGPYTLTLTGSAAITATSLNIAAGTTVQLASGTTLANGRIVTTSVTGAGVIGYTGVNPDDSVGYGNSATWTGTVWVQGLTGLVNWNPTAFGNSESTLRLSGVAGYFANGQISLPFAIELENGIYSYGIDLTNGYSFNSNGGWGYVIVPMLKGSGTYKTSGSGGNLFVVTDDWSGFTGNFTLANKTVWLGYGTPTAEVDYTPGTVAGGIRIAEGKSVNWSTSWTLSKFFGEGTIKMAAPWDATPAFAGYVGDSALWTGTVELAACVNDGTGSVGVYPDRMGNANSKIVFKGLAPGATKGYYFNGSTSAMVQLDGDVTISDGSSNATYSLGILTGTGSFTGATSLGNACTFAFSAVSNYTGTISANSKSLVTIGTYMSDVDVAVGTKLVSVDSDNAYVTLRSVAVAGGEPQTVATAAQLGDDGYGVYVTAVQRDVYWVGGASGSWSDTTAWALADGTPLGSYPQDYTQYAGDNVVFTNAVIVTVDKQAVVTKFTLNADVEFVSDNTQGKGLFFDVMEGSGKVTLNKVWVAVISEGAGRNFVINNDVCLADGSDNTLNGASLVNYLYGDISGSGNITVKYKHSTETGGTRFCGDNSGFAGVLTFARDSGAYSRFWLDGSDAGSANAVWKNIYCYAPSGNAYLGSTYLMTVNGSYKFGGIQGGVFYGSSDVSIEIGAREDFDSTFELKTHGSRPRGYITKVGSGVLTLNGFPYVLTLKGGTTYLGDAFGFADYSSRSAHVTFAGEGATLAFSGYTGDPSARIKNSTSAICFDDGGTDYIWATALESSNVGGLTKLGSGTLTLSVVPQYKGPTTVAAGKLVVPFGTKFESLTINGDGCVEVDMTDATENSIAFSSGTFTGDLSKVTLVNVPEGYTVQNLGSANNIIYGNGSVTYTWIGPTSDDYSWETDTNWSPTGVPGAIDEVIFQTATPGFTLASDTSVLAMTVNAAGFTYSADYALTVVDTLTVVSAGTVTITGSGSLEVNGEISGVNSVAMTPKAATDAIINAHPYYTEMFRASTDLELTSLSGAGTINSSVGQSVTVAENETSTFYGSFTGSMGLTKSGEGTLELQGPNSFTGDIAIDAGKLAVSRYNFDSLVSYNFDASSVAKWTFADSEAGTISKMATSTGTGWTFKSAGSAYAYLTNGFFGGRTSVYFPAYSQYVPDYTNQKDHRAFSVFTVAQTEDVASTKYLHCYSTSQDYIGLSGGYWMAHTYNSYINNLLYVDGVHGRVATASKRSVVSLLSEYACSNNRWDALGIANSANGYVGAVGEIIGLNVRASIEQRAAIEAYLMQKWGCDDAEDHQILPKTANVTMNAAATLDLGGMAQTVASFAGAGTIANGYLKTTGDFTATGSLTVQAVEGQTYTLSTSRGDRVTFTGAATGYAVQPQDGAGAASRFVVPNGITVGFDRDGDFDVTIINAPVKWTLKADVGAESTTYRIGSYPFQLYLR